MFKRGEIWCNFCHKYVHIFVWRNHKCSNRPKNLNCSYECLSDTVMWCSVQRCASGSVSLSIAPSSRDFLFCPRWDKLLKFCKITSDFLSQQFCLDPLCICPQYEISHQKFAFNNKFDLKFKATEISGASHLPISLPTAGILSYSQLSIKIVLQCLWAGQASP